MSAESAHSQESTAIPHESNRKNKMTTENTSRKVTFIKTENRWFPITNDMIDKRGKGHPSKRAIKEWAAHRAEMTGEKITVEFRK